MSSRMGWLCIDCLVLPCRIVNQKGYSIESRLWHSCRSMLNKGLSNVMTEPIRATRRTASIPSMFSHRPQLQATKWGKASESKSKVYVSGHVSGHASTCHSPAVDTSEYDCSPTLLIEGCRDPRTRNRRDMCPIAARNCSVC